MEKDIVQQWIRPINNEDNMIIENQEDVTKAVLAELDRATDEWFKEIMLLAVKHLHSFVR